MAAAPSTISFGVHYNPFPQLRRTDEVAQFTSFYNSKGVFFGVNNPIEGSNADWFWQVGLSEINGNERSMGSSRLSLDPFIGYRWRLSDTFSLAPKLGLSLASNNLNFGRGFPLETEYSLNGQIQLPLTAKTFCYSENSCLEVGVAAYVERSLAGNVPSYWNYGGLLTIGWELGPSSDKKAETEPASLEVVERWRVVTINSGAAKPDEKQKPVVTVRRVARPKTDSTVSFQRYIDALRRGPYEPALLAAPKIVYFTNDNPDIILGPQWFSSVDGGRLSECFSNPDLDPYTVLLGKVIRKAQGLKQNVEFTLRVKGYANETGPQDRNQKIAAARADSVVGYLTGHLEPHLDIFGRKEFAARRKELAKYYGANLQAFTGRNEKRLACGPLDNENKPMNVLIKEPVSQYLKIVNENESPSGENGLLVEGDSVAANLPKDPANRLVRIELDIKDVATGRLLSDEEKYIFLQSLPSDE